MEKQQKVSIWYVVLGIWFVLILQNFLVSAFAIKTIAYSEFLKLLQENKVIEVAISANQIQGKFKEGEGPAAKEVAFRTVRVDPETSKLLTEYNVPFKGEIESQFLANLLSWLIPIFLFLGVWFFLMKRMAGQQPGFMTLGKNKAKIYMQEDIEIRFADVAGAGEGKIESALNPKPPNLKQELFLKKLQHGFPFFKKSIRRLFSLMLQSGRA